MNHQPRYYKKEGADTILIFIHGIVEGPDQFIDLMELSLKLGFSVASLLLPGHGGTGKDFAQSNKTQWINHVNTKIEFYKKNYKRVILCGHSMGVLLSFIHYVQYPDKVTCIIAIDSPLHVWVKKRAIKNNLKIGLSLKLDENDPAQALLRASSVAPCPLFTYIMWIPRILDLFRLMKTTRNILHKVTIPTLVIHANKDELVSISSLKVFKKAIPTTYLQIVRLPESTHFEYKGQDLATLHNVFTQFLHKVLTIPS